MNLNIEEYVVMQIAAGKIKAQFLAIIDEVQARGAPEAMLVPIEEHPPQPFFGMLRHPSRNKGNDDG